MASVKIRRRKKMTERKLRHEEAWHEAGDGSWGASMCDTGNSKGIQMDFCEQGKRHRVGSI